MATNFITRTTFFVKGFTLIVLLVTISIIAVLSVVGFTSFTQVREKAWDAKKKADIDAIRKAYEQNFDPTENNGQGGYKKLRNDQFANGKIPTQPDGRSYIAVIGPPSADGSFPAGAVSPSDEAFRVCTPINNNTVECNRPAENCYCGTSTLGDNTVIAQLDSSSSPSCDTNGTLSVGLVGYWKLDENTGALQTEDSSVYGNNAIVYGSKSFAQGKFGNAINGVDSYAVINTTTVNNILNNFTNKLTVSVWFKESSQSSWHRVFSRHSWQVNNEIPSRPRWGMFNYPPAAGNGTLTGKLGIENGLGNGMGSTYVLAINQWYHAVLKVDSPNTTLYIFGDSGGQWRLIESKNTPTTSGEFTNLGNIGIGADGGGPAPSGTPYPANSWGLGLIDEFRIYSRVLSDSEIDALDNGGNGCISP